MANNIISNGVLLVWSGLGTIQNGSFQLEKCGPSRNQNRSGIAVWIDGPDITDYPILLPGDAGYTDIRSLRNGKRISSFAVAHHGGQASGRPQTNPRLRHSRAAISCGRNNSYGHPLGTSMAKLARDGWHSSGTNPDVFYTENRPTTGTQLGHVMLRWPRSQANTHHCARCNSTLQPHQ